MPDQVDSPTPAPAPAKPSVDWVALGKYASGAGIFGSMFYLALIGKIPVNEFSALAYAGLTALGYHIASK